MSVGGRGWGVQWASLRPPRPRLRSRDRGDLRNPRPRRPPGCLWGGKELPSHPGEVGVDRSLKTPRGPERAAGPRPAQETPRPPLLSPAGGGRGLHSGRGVPGGAAGGPTRPRALRSPPPGACFAFNTIGRWGLGGEKKKKKKPTAKTLYKKTPELSRAPRNPAGRGKEGRGGRGARWSRRAGNSLKNLFRSDRWGRPMYRGKEGVTRGLPPGPRGPRTGWRAAAAGPAWTGRAGTAASSVR